MMKAWKVVDERGDTVIDAETISIRAAMHRTSPRVIAQREARDYVNVEAGDRPVFAVPA